MSAEIAHVVLIDADGWRVLTGWRMGPYLTGYLADGPDGLWEYVTTTDAAEPVQPDEWRLAEISDDGGVVIDRVRRELIWFTDGPEMRVPVLRRLFLRVLEKIWAGWRMRWAYQGFDELVASVPSQRHTLCRLQPHHHADHPGWRPELLAEVRLPDDGDLSVNQCPGYSLLTVRDASGVRAWAYDDIIRTGHLAWRGAVLLDRLPTDGLRHGRLGCPSAGLHLDTVSNELGYWTVSVVGNLASEMDQLWPGMRVSFWQDTVERHAESITDAIALSPIDEAAVLRPGGILDEVRRDPLRLFAGSGFGVQKGVTADRAAAAVTEVLWELGVEPDVCGQPTA